MANAGTPPRKSVCDKAWVGGQAIQVGRSSDGREMEWREKDGASGCEGRDAKQVRVSEQGVGCGASFWGKSEFGRARDGMV